MTDAWLALPLESWRDTYGTLHLWTQIVGKTRLSLAPMQNHWWQVALYVTERGLTTSAIPAGHRTFAVEFDLLEHNLSIRDSDGELRTLARPGRGRDLHSLHRGPDSRVLRRRVGHAALSGAESGRPSAEAVQGALPR